MLRRHHHERMPQEIARAFHRRGVADLKADLWNAFVDSDLIGINDADCSALPRILPLSYLPVIRAAARDVVEFLMKLLSLPDREIVSIIPPTPVRDYLIRELGVLRYRRHRLTGSLRLDMAIVGEPGPSNPPRLLEVNDIGFDGTGRSSYIQETILRLVPGLGEKVVCLDTAASEVRNMRRLGRDAVRILYEAYNWEDQVIRAKAEKAGMRMRFVSPDVFNLRIDRDCPLLRRERVFVKDGRLHFGDGKPPPDLFQLSYSFELSDFEESPGLFRDLIRAENRHYSPFITGLISSKAVLLCLEDAALRRRFLGDARARRLAASLIPTRLLAGNEGLVVRGGGRYALKHADGMGGEQVHVGHSAAAVIRKIPKAERAHWVVQDRVRLNTIDVDGFLSRKRRVICDLGIYCHYDWDGRRFGNFAVGGFITRATNRSMKVNVSGGGIQVPVMFAK
jgi:hypothetical protein